jgi:hypothetical protein
LGPVWGALYAGTSIFSRKSGKRLTEKRGPASVEKRVTELITWAAKSLFPIFLAVSAGIVML